jgi:hypothetical protein
LSLGQQRAARLVAALVECDVIADIIIKTSEKFDRKWPQPDLSKEHIK